MAANSRDNGKDVELADPVMEGANGRGGGSGQTRLCDTKLCGVGISSDVGSPSSAP